MGGSAIRLFSVLYHRTLNAGSVQTPTLSLLAAQDAKIALFQEERRRAASEAAKKQGVNGMCRSVHKNLL